MKAQASPAQLPHTQKKKKKKRTVLTKPVTSPFFKKKKKTQPIFLTSPQSTFYNINFLLYKKEKKKKKKKIRKYKTQPTKSKPVNQPSPNNYLRVDLEAYSKIITATRAHQVFFNFLEIFHIGVLWLQV